MHIALFIKWTIKSKFCWKKNYFILFFLQSYFFDEKSKFLILPFYWNKKFKHRFIYEWKWNKFKCHRGKVSLEKREQKFVVNKVL